MRELNELIDFYEMTGGEPQLLVMLIELRRHRMDNWKQRAEAAEAKLSEVEQKKAQWVTWAKEGCAEADRLKAKLAELEKQEPVAWGDLQHLKKFGYCAAFENKSHVIGDPGQLFTRPAPAINLADLVPDEGFLEETSDESMLTWQRGWNACRAAILRKIEEKSK